MPTPFDTQPQPEQAKRLLARTRVIQNACDLDVLVFLYRHPRTLLTSEQIAGFVGYNLKDIAKTLEAFIEADLLGRTAQQSAHAARMFLLLPTRAEKELLELALTRAGRQAILEALNGERSRPEEPKGDPELRLVKRM